VNNINIDEMLISGKDKFVLKFEQENWSVKPGK